MDLAIMQPYFFPYLGYFQLARSVDTFVLYDDVQFVKRSWINRNFILSREDKERITLNVKGGSQNRLINQVGVGENKSKILETIRWKYSKAPYFKMAYPVVEEAIALDEPNLAMFLGYGVERICSYLGIRPAWHWSSDLEKDPSLKGKDKILDICQRLGANHYINLPGGRHLYDRNEFEGQGIKLSFIEPGNLRYEQYGERFVPNLSVIDAMMFNNPEQLAYMLSDYSLV